MSLLKKLSFLYFIFAALPFAHAQTAIPAYEIFQREVYPFLQERCAECHGKNQFDAPQHSPIGDPQSSYKQILGYVHLSQDWEQSSRLITFGGTRHCKEYLGTDNCGADRAELLSVVRKWIGAEISVHSNIQPTKKSRAQKIMAANESPAAANQNLNPNNSKSLKIIQISTGGSHVCALFENKKAKCWGNNERGQLGIGSNKASIGGSPEEIKLLPYVFIDEPIVQISAGDSHTCALFENKKAKCWGHNKLGQLGIGTDESSFGRSPQEMRSLPYVSINEPILQIIAGSKHTCVLIEDQLKVKRMKCWGNNGYGQLGIGSQKESLGTTSAEMQSLPYVLIDEPIVQIAAGGNRTCALIEIQLKDKRMKCWGDNYFGTLGIGTNAGTIGSNKQEMLSLSYSLINNPIFQIALAHNHTCVLLQNQKAKCWGFNFSGQTGAGNNKNLPVNTFLEMQSLPNVLIDEPIVQIAVGASHTCVLLENRKAKCWGDNEYGQLGIGRVGNPDSMKNLPYVLVSDKITQISASDVNTCFLLENGRMKCVGNNANGQLGTGDTASRGIFDVDGNDAFPDALVTAQEGE